MHTKILHQWLHSIHGCGPPSHGKESMWTAEPFQGRMLLVLVDTHSKWPEVFVMQLTSSYATIRVLRHLFATYRLPQQLVSDNGAEFSSAEFGTFFKQISVKQLKSALYHPSTNGAAEWFVQTLSYAALSYVPSQEFKTCSSLWWQSEFSSMTHVLFTHLSYHSSCDYKYSSMWKVYWASFAYSTWSVAI